MRRIIIILLLLLSLSSCESRNFKKLYESGSYELLYSKTSTKLSKGLNEEALYYNALASYKMNDFTTTAKRAELYYYIYEDEDDENRRSILRLMLYTAEPNLAYEAANELMESYKFNKADSVQYYKILNQIELYTAASKYLSEIRSSFTTAEVAFAVINADAQSWQILAAMEDLYKEEGVSENFLSAAKLAFPMMTKKEGLSSVELFISKTYNKEADYALLLGDFYFSIRDKDKALNYWSDAFKEYPNIVEERSKLIF